MYACLCGFKTWESVIQAISTQKPSKVDEECEEELLMDRKAFYRQILDEVFDISPPYVEHMVDHLSPSSGKIPKKFVLERESLFDGLRSGLTDLLPPGMDMKMLQEGMRDFVAFLEERMPEMAGMDPASFKEKLRALRPVDPADYFNFCDSFGWDIIEESYNEDYEHCKPMFCLNSSHGDVLVYANSLSKLPTNNDDEVADQLKAAVLADAREGSDFPVVLLFAGRFMAMDHQGKGFTCGGCLYKDGEWYDFLLNHEMTTVDKLIEAAEADIDLSAPDPAYEDMGGVALVTFLAATSGLPSLEDVIKHEILIDGTPAGWGTVMLGKRM